MKKINKTYVCEKAATSTIEWTVLKDTQIPNEYLEKCSAALFIRKMEIKSTLRFLSNTGNNKMATIRKNEMVTNAEENVKKESFYTPLTELLSGAATL